jgi:glutaredoxin domain-containing cysteine-rich protein 1
VVLYTTSMGIVRSTYTKCQTVKKILNTLMVKYEERDVFMSTVHQQEIRERMETDEIDVPHLFVDGQYIGVSSTQRSFLQFAEARKSRLIDGGKIELEWKSGMCGSL